MAVDKNLRGSITPLPPLNQAKSDLQKVSPQLVISNLPTASLAGEAEHQANQNEQAAANSKKN